MLDGRDVDARGAILRLHEAINSIIRNSLRLRHAWMAVGGISLLDAIWSRAIGFTVSGYAPALVLTIELLAATVILRQLWQDPKLAVATEVVALWIVFVCSFNVLTYLSATPGLPLRDEMLASGDSALGFEWPALFHWVSQHPNVDRLLSTCYHSLLPEVLILCVWLSLGRHEERVGEFFWIACLAILLTCILSAAVPAAGPLDYYGRRDWAWLPNLEALRSGSNLHFALQDMVGIVVFPSFHTIVALLVIYISRAAGVVGLSFVIWNVIMLFAISPMGGHYLVDMIGGVVVLAVSISIVRYAARSRLRYARSFGSSRAPDALPTHDGHVGASSD